MTVPHIAANERIASMDQFRGYAVVGMVLVNFVGAYDAVHSVFKHNDTYLSYADTIIVNFLFITGFSYRLTMLRRLKQATWIETCLSYIRRSFVLIFASMLLFGFAGRFREWNDLARMPRSMASADDPVASSGMGRPSLDPSRMRRRRQTKNSRVELEQMTPEDRNAAIIADRARRRAERTESQPQATPPDDQRKGLISDPEFRRTFFAHGWVLLAQQLKNNLWETFAIIGVTQLVILPLVAERAAIRLLAMCGFAVLHVALTYWFNWGFVLGYEDNWMVQLWKTGPSASWDGGFFGPLIWAVVMLAGTLAYDIVASDDSRRRAMFRLLAAGVVMTLAGYSLSCLTRLYDTDVDQFAPEPNLGDLKRAASPVVPRWDSLPHRSLRSLLAEPPFVSPPFQEYRLENYWMMSKKFPTLSFILAATGVTLITYSIFVWLSDIHGLQLGILRTFGTNPLLAYCVNELFHSRIENLIIRDAPLWFCMLSFLAYFLAIYAVVRFFERRQIFIRL